MVELTAADRLIVALDTESRDQATRLVEALGDEVGFYKVGMLRLLESGVDFVKMLTGLDKRVFLDLKSFDIAQTVASTVAQARRMGAEFVTVHGSTPAIAAAAQAAQGDVKVLAVTILTSLSRRDVNEIYGIDTPIRDLALEMARLMTAAGCDGVISSAEEARRLREELAPEVLIVTPGIRLGSDSEDDHHRTGTPRQAIADGADYLVVGRPIYAAPDPVAAAREYIDEIQRGLEDRA